MKTLKLPLKKKWYDMKKLEEKAELCQQYQEIYGDNFATAYMKGYTDGYKEAIKAAKEWLKENVPIIHAEEGDYVRVHKMHKNVSMNVYLTTFETDMDKLWEEKK